MEHKSTSITRLLQEIRAAFRKDWKMQRKKGQRDSAPSMSKTDIRLYEIYPDDVSENFLKTIDVYARRGLEMETSKLRLFLEYLFVHDPVEAGWPEVVHKIKNFEEGRFYPLVEKYLNGVETPVSEFIHANALIRAGANPNEDVFTQLIQVASIAKAQSRRDKQTIVTMAQENEKLKSLLKSEKEVNKEIETLAKSIRDRLSQMEIGPEKDKLTKMLSLIVDDFEKLNN